MSPEYPFDYVIVFVLGTLLGSFANVCIYRLPQRLSIIFPGSHCPSCQEALRPWHNVPLLSYVLLGGRCATCKTTISLRYPLVELGNVLSVVILHREGMGGGDIKLIAMIGAFLGWPAVFVTIFLGAVLGALVGIILMLVRLKGRKEPLPFGPFLALGAFLAMVWGDTMLTWYFSHSP